MADIINGQVIGREEIRYNCGIFGQGNCYDRFTYRVRKFNNYLIITYTNDSQRGWPEERVVNEEWLMNADARSAFDPEFRQNLDLWKLLAKQSYLSAQKIGDGSTRLASKYLEDNETVLTPALFVKQTTSGNTNTGNGGTDNGGTNNGSTNPPATTDDMVPWIIGGVIGLCVMILVIVVATRR